MCLRNKSIMEGMEQASKYSISCAINKLILSAHSWKGPIQYLGGDTVSWVSIVLYSEFQLRHSNKNKDFQEKALEVCRIFLMKSNPLQFQTFYAPPLIQSFLRHRALNGKEGTKWETLFFNKNTLYKNIRLKK